MGKRISVLKTVGWPDGEEAAGQHGYPMFAGTSEPSRRLLRGSMIKSGTEGLRGSA